MCRKGGVVRYSELLHINFLSMRGPIELVKDAMNLMFGHFGLFFGILVIPAIFMTVYSYFVEFYSEAFEYGAVPEMMETVLVVVGAVLVFFLQILSLGALIKAVSDPESHNVSGAYRMALRHGWVLILASLLLALVIGVGYLLFIIPGILFYVWFIFVPYAVMCEGKGVIESFKASKGYTKGHWWAVFGRAAFLALVMIIAMLVVFIPLSFVMSMLGYGTVGLIVEAVFSLALNVLFTAFSMGYIYLMYKDLKDGAMSPVMDGGEENQMQQSESQSTPAMGNNTPENA